jgi:hypothetical protein
MKRFFRIFFSIFFIAVLYAAWGIILSHKEETRTLVQNTLKINQPCMKPLEFSIGIIDQKFGITSEELITLSRQASGIWNQAAGKEVLGYNPAAPVKINLVFDERQQTTLEAQKLENDLNQLEIYHENLSGQYNSLSAVYRKKIDDYNKALANYKEKLDKYNVEVDYWNENGGAPSGEFDKLKKQKKDLAEEFDKIDKQRLTINKLISDSNKLVSQENKIVNSYNSSLVTYKTQFGTAREFEKGVFSGKEINIYQFQKTNDLEMTLVHELGHYLGLDHVENPASIMYYLMGDQDLNNPAPTAEDLAEIKKVCRIN